MTDEVIEQNPTENVLQTEPVATPEPVAEVIEPIESEPAPEPVETSQEQEDKRKNPWFLKRISAEAEARRLAEQRATDAEAMLERLQKGQENPVATTLPSFQNDVQKEFARLRLAEESTSIRDAGFREYGRQFNDTLAVLNGAGAVSDDIVMDLIAVDKANAHKILAELAGDQERAYSLAQMDPRRRVVELTRIATHMSSIENSKSPAKAPAAPVKQVSKAPAPPPPVEPSSTKSVPWYSDEASDADFDKGFYSSDRLKKRQRL